jgi:chromosome segregation ATPase
MSELRDIDAEIEALRALLAAKESVRNEILRESAALKDQIADAENEWDRLASNGSGVARQQELGDRLGLLRERLRELTGEEPG